MRLSRIKNLKGKQKNRFPQCLMGARMTRKKRQHDVEQMNANFAIEGFTPDETDKKLQEDYVNGAVTTDDMLRHAHEFAEKAKRDGK